jgi:hypothetical protein
MTSRVQRRWCDDASVVERRLLGTIIVSASPLERVRALPSLRGGSLLLVLASAAAAPVLLTYQAVEAVWSGLRGLPSQEVVVTVLSWPAWLIVVLAAAPPLAVLGMVAGRHARGQATSLGAQDDFEGQIGVPSSGLLRWTEQHSQEKLIHEDPSERVPRRELPPR